MENFDLWKEVLEYGRFAPSPHNVQPWKVKLVSATTADLFYDPKRLLPAEDPTGRFLMAGFGIFIETLSIAAKEKGYTVKADFTTKILDSNKKGPMHLAKLSLVASKERDNLNRELIKQRKTSRLAYKQKPIEESLAKELAAIAANFGQVLTFTSEQEKVKWVLELNRDTMLHDMNDDKARNEVGLWVRYSSKQAYAKKDGLWSYCMNTAAGLMYLFFKARWVINLPGIYQLVGRSYLATTRAGTIAWLQGPFKNAEDWLNSGRMLMRLWLTMTKNGVYLHPFGSIITNNNSHKKLREKFEADESINDLWLIMRLGYSDAPPQSLRLSLEDILI